MFTNTNECSIIRKKRKKKRRKKKEEKKIPEINQKKNVIKKKDNLKSLLNNFKSIKKDMNLLLNKNEKEENITHNTKIEENKILMNKMYDSYIDKIKKKMNNKSKNNNSNIQENNNQNKRLHGEILTSHKYVNKADYNTVFNDNANTLEQEILVDDKLIINNKIEIGENAITEINNAISEFMVKIDFGLNNVSRDDVLQLKILVYNLLNLEEEPELVNKNSVLPIN